MKPKRKRVKNPRIRSDGYAKDVVYSLDIDCIRANAAQPRKDFDIESIIKLADSIRRYGILQPLTVRRVSKEDVEGRKKKESRRKKNLVADVLAATMGELPDEAPVSGPGDADIWGGVYVSRETEVGAPIQLCIPDVVPLMGSSFEGLRRSAAEDGEMCPEPTGFGVEDCDFCASAASTSVFVPNDACQYELIAGERRLRAAKMLGLRQVPCIIVDVNDALSAELALVENMLRESLNMFEQAEAFSHLAEKYSLTQEEIASRMSLSQSAVANKIRLLKLQPRERELIVEAGLTERHARAFLRVTDGLLREACVQTVIEKHLNVSETDKYITAVLEKTTAATEPEVPTEAACPSPDKLCANIYKFINRMQTASGNYLIVNRRSDEKSVVITLTVRKGS